MAIEDIYLPVRVGTSLQCAIVRLARDPRVLFQIAMAEELKGKFDRYRLAAVWFDGKLEIDFCLVERMHEMTMGLSPPAVSFAFEERSLLGVVWHGVVSEGIGVIGKLMEAGEVRMRVYFDDYTTQDFLVSAEELATLKQGVLSQLLRP